MSRGDTIKQWLSLFVACLLSLLSCDPVFDAVTKQVRAVTDIGAVPALTRALARMDLNHSRAPACGAALVRPLEMLTR